MLAKIWSAVNLTLTSQIIEIEVDLSDGFPTFQIVGLPDKAVEEAKERVRSAIKNSGLKFPLQKRVIVNLAPADLKKEGPAYDLPIALGILLADRQIPLELFPTNSFFIGELALNGELRHTKGILPAALFAQERGIENFFIPATNLEEAKLVRRLKIFPLKSLAEFLAHLTGFKKIEPVLGQGFKIQEKEDYEIDFAYIRGQETVKRALEISAAGGHHLLMFGPPGTGKTLLARALPSILPTMTEQEILEVSKIYSVAGLLKDDQPYIAQRPFRSPHHTISDMALIGGGGFPRPGEISLAHRGVLFLDEISEFSHRVLETLRQPLEDGLITVTRVKGSLKFPAQFILVASQNPCPCGYFGDRQKTCCCSPAQITHYHKKISGPLLDRIDLYLEVPRLSFEKLNEEKVAESSSVIRKRVERARAIQQKRFISSRSDFSLLTNAEMSHREIKKFCQLDNEATELLKEAVEKFYLSARAYYRILKVSRTIADLENKEKITSAHLAEAIQYRVKLEERRMI